MTYAEMTPEQQAEWRAMLHRRIDYLCDVSESMNLSLSRDTAEDGFEVGDDGEQYPKLKPGPNYEFVLSCVLNEPRD